VASLDADDISVASAEPGDHIVWRPKEYQLLNLALKGGNRALVSGVSPSGDYFVETIAGIDRLPVTALRRRDGKLVMTLEAAEAVDLPPGWQWPERVKLKAADGETDIHGLLFRPVEFDSSKTYPLIDYVYGGPQLVNTPVSVFGDGKILSAFAQAAGYSYLGAFCLVLDGRGAGFRERAFREASYGRLETGSDLEDHMAAIRQLSQLDPAIDLNRVGVTGFSCGGFTAALAALRYGDFFKVSVAASGNYDQALFWSCWGERYQGRYSPELYASAAAKTYAQGLSGKLLLIHGLMDSGCHPTVLFQLVQALIEQNKDVELVVLPRAGHEITGYGYRRLLDYFVTHLFGSVPPVPEVLRTPMDAIAARARFNAAPPPSQTPSVAAQPSDSPADDMGRLVRVALSTPHGRIIAELYPDRAPISVAAFLDYIDRDAYGGATFVRTIRPDNDNGEPPIEAIQAFVANFDPAGPGVAHETTSATGVRHLDGALSLARLAVGTGTPGTFFVCVGDQPALDFGGQRNPDGQGFAAFGRVVEGADVVRLIHQSPTRKDAPAEQLAGQLLIDPVPILSTTRL
jgi:cyclophilin family peptidyl-prolyl cis-trans isomerase/dienelactone hydrolase